MRKRITSLSFLHKLSILVFISLYILFLSTGTSVVRVSAEGDTENAQLEEMVNGQLEKLDLEELQKYIDSLGDFSNKPIRERIIEYIKGGEFDYKTFLENLGEVFFEQVLELFPLFACITAITLLSGIIISLKSSSVGQTSSEMIFIITYAAALIPLFGVLMGVFRTSLGAISSMRKQMQLIYPLMLTLMSASGGTISVSVCRPAVAFFSTTIVSVVDSFVLPLTITIIVFSMVSKFTKELKIGKFTAFYKSLNKWIIGVCVSVFGIFFTLQGITSVTYDGIVRRAAKYAIGNGIPIVGGFLSSGFDLAVAGGILIKNSLGTMGIFLLLSVLFEPIALLVAVNILLRLVSAITQPFGDGRLSDFLGETAENLNYCTASVLFVAFLYFLSIMVMIFSTEALL